jgi:hypothetical protein
MKMETNLKRAPRSYRPLLSIEPVVKLVTRKFEIKETAAELITQYAKFMSERSASVVKEDAVVEHLALLIGKDKVFKEWAGSQSNSASEKAGN